MAPHFATGSVALMAAIAAVGTTDAFVANGPLSAGVAPATRSMSSTKLSMSAERKTMNPVVAAAMGLIIAGADPAGIIHMNPTPPAVQALQTPEVQTPADAVKAGNNWFGNNPFGGKNAQPNGGLFGNGKENRKAGAVDGTPGQQLSDNLGKGANVASKAKQTADNVSGAAGNAGKAAGGAKQAADNVAQAGGVGNVADKAKQAAGSVAQAGGVGDLADKAKGAVAQVGGPGEAVNKAKGAADSVAQAGGAGDVADKAKDAAGTVAQAKGQEAEVAGAGTSNAADSAKNALKGALSTLIAVPDGTQFVGFGQAQNDAAGRVQGAKEKVSEDIQNTKNAGNVKIAGRDAGDAVDAIKGAVGGKVNTDLNRAGRAADKAGDAAGNPGKVAKGAKDALKGASSSTFSSATAGTTFVSFDAGQAKSDAAGRVQGAKEKVGEDIRNTKNAGNVKIAGRDAGDAADAIKGAVGGKVSKDLNRAGNALDNPNNVLQAGKDAITGKVSKDVDTAKGAVGVGFGDAVGKALGGNVGGKVGSDIENTKKAGAKVGGEVLKSKVGQNAADNSADTEGGIGGLFQSKTGEFQPTGKKGQQYQTQRPDNKQGIPGVTDQRSVQAQ